MRSQTIKSNPRVVAPEIVVVQWRKRSHDLFETILSAQDLAPDFESIEKKFRVLKKKHLHKL